MSRRTAANAVGIAGAAAALVAAGGALIIERMLRTRAARAGDPYGQEPFGSLVADRSMAVVARDGVVLPLDEDGTISASLTVVFIHGYGLHRGAFHFQRQALRAEFGDRVRLVQYDQRGHGAAQRGSADRATVQQLAADLATVLDGAAASGEVLLVGHSMGGMAVLQLAQDRPELFGEHIVAVALIATPLHGLPPLALGRPGSVQRSPALTSWLVGRRMSLADRTSSPAVADYLDGILAQCSPDAVADFYPALTAFDGVGGLDALRQVHVAVLAGEDDRLVPVSHSEELDSELAHSELHVIADAGHVVLLESPREVNGVLIEMVREILARQATGRRRTP